MSEAENIGPETEKVLNEIEGEEEVETFRFSIESAERQFRVLLKYYDVAFSDIEIEGGEKAALTMKNFLVRSIRRGRLEIELEERKVKITHHLDFPTDKIDKIIYRDKVAIARLAVNKAEEEDDQTMIFMATMSGVNIGEFIKLQGADNTVYSRLSTVFSMV